ncbi:MAG: helix-turn-helix domain-containing protein [Gammaproteobacteria bacterium]|nr:helix-turn-helix domain-containing protein [Gammaproteobacteria bacterium]
MTVEIPVRRCKSCGFEFTDREAEEIKHEAVCRHLGLLSPNGIRAIRGMHGMSRAAFSKVSGIGEATLNRWENGLLVQNRANDRFLRLLASPENVRKLQALDSGRTCPTAVDADRFRAIHVSEQLRHQQANFHIQCVA